MLTLTVVVVESIEGPAADANAVTTATKTTAAAITGMKRILFGAFMSPLFLSHVFAEAPLGLPTSWLISSAAIRSAFLFVLLWCEGAFLLILYHRTAFCK